IINRTPEVRKYKMIMVATALSLILFMGMVLPSLAQSQHVDSLLNKAQTLEPGIHGMSDVPNVKITGVTISSEKAISINLRYNGTEATSPPIIIVANALTNRTEQAPMEGSQVLSEGWISPNNLTISLNGSSSLYDLNLVSVIASPYGSTTILQK
ncbi:MAG: hypothetical protein QN715_11155, partial [Nitrososphaeraceae archaeon]|nr:hypothetical protein [Nitrososphaeraceae archaeon]